MFNHVNSTVLLFKASTRYNRYINVPGYAPADSLNINYLLSPKCRFKLKAVTGRNQLF